MQVPFEKYHALANDFVVVRQTETRLSRAWLNRLALKICDRRTGIGADGLLYLSVSRSVEPGLDVYNADGSWAEKSGNGLRIAGVSEYLKDRRRRRFVFRMADDLAAVRIVGKAKGRYKVTTDVGQPDFLARSVPISSRQRYHINSPLTVSGVDFTVTCVAVGNPHAVLFVDRFDFDWAALGDEIEHHRRFPNRTNVEFVRVVNRRCLEVAEWERGAGATGSSGTGAAAAVCVAAQLGLVERRCRVQFATGTLLVHWRRDDNRIELTGPVESIGRGVFDFQ